MGPCSLLGVSSGWWSSAGGPSPGHWRVSDNGSSRDFSLIPMGHHALPTWLLLSCVGPLPPLSGKRPFVGIPP